MSCAYKAWTSSAAIPKSSEARFGLAFLKAIIGAFQEAAELRRIAHRSYFLGDE
jgi:hypothetical protein